MNRNQNDPTNQRQQDDQAGRQPGQGDVGTSRQDKQPGNPQAENDPRRQNDQDGRKQQNVDQDGKQDSSRKPSQPDSQQQGRDSQRR